MTRALVIAIAVLVGCGDEGGTTSNSPPPPPAGGAPGAKPAAKPKGKGAVMKDTIKIEDRVSEMERPTIRRALREADYRPDPLGMDNRDPFRSYVVNQGNLDTGLSSQGPTEEKKCDENAMVASNYNLRDLRLVGIVTKGVNKYALFQDPSDYGHIVRRRECLGREKAKVKDIGAGFVTLEITPEQSASAPARPTEERSIPLYPNELKLGETDRGRGASPSGVAPPAMPTGGTDPVLPSEPVQPAPVTPPTTP